jgi:hypothetical protein
MKIRNFINDHLNLIRVIVFAPFVIWEVIYVINSKYVDSFFDKKLLDITMAELSLFLAFIYFWVKSDNKKEYPCKQKK